MKLQDIVGYLPYELKLLHKYYIETDNGYVWKEDVVIMSILNEYKTHLQCEYTKMSIQLVINDDKITPLLIPVNRINKKDVSDFAKKFYGVRFDDSTLELIIFSKLNENSRDIPKWFFDYCYKNHIDINGLIEKGEALDINDIQY